MSQFNKVQMKLSLTEINSVIKNIGFNNTENMDSFKKNKS